MHVLFTSRNTETELSRLFCVTIARYASSWVTAGPSGHVQAGRHGNRTSTPGSEPRDFGFEP